MSPPSVPSTRRTYTLPENVVELFENEAQRRDMHPSTLLTQLLKKWLMFDLPLQKVGNTMTIPEPCFQAILDSIDAEKLQQVAEEQSNKNFGLILSLFNGRYSLESIMQSYYHRFGKYSGWFSFKYDAPDNNNGQGVHQLILQHTRGIKWSKYLASYNHTVLERVCGKVDCRIDDKVVVFDVMPRQRTTIER